MMWVQLITAALWPATVLIVFFMIRGTIQDIVPRISTFKYRDFELEIAKHIGDAENSLVALESDPGAKGFSFGDISAIQSDPQSAFATKWGELEAVVLGLYKKHAGAGSEIDLLSALGKLQAMGVADDNIVRAFNELYQIKNIILFNKSLDNWQSVRQIFSAIVLIEKIKHELSAA